MEIESELDIEIFQTLNLIKRTEEMLELHKSREDFSELAITQYQKMKDDLSKQLAQLLAKYNLNVQILPLAA
jgi:anion-transporting  ArsA/GET3 family ATPase